MRLVLEPWVCVANIHGEMSLRCFVLNLRDSEPSVAFAHSKFLLFLVATHSIFAFTKIGGFESELTENKKN